MFDPGLRGNILQEAYKLTLEALPRAKAMYGANFRFENDGLMTKQERESVIAIAQIIAQTYTQLLIAEEIEDK